MERKLINFKNHVNERRLIYYCFNKSFNQNNRQQKESKNSDNHFSKLFKYKGTIMSILGTIILVKNGDHSFNKF
jgi:hypothetical protein